MSHQEYAETYRAAMDAATGELESLFEEAKRLRNRMEQIDSAISALKVLVGTGSEATSADALANEMSASPHNMQQQFDSTLGLALV